MIYKVGPHAYIALGILILIVFLVCIIRAFVIRSKSSFLFSLIALAAGLFFLLSGIHSSNNFIGAELKTNDYIETTPIISVSNSTTTNGSGSFSLGSGSFVIATGEVYRYYYETPEGIRQGTVPANDTVIKYTDEPPVLRFVKHTSQEIKTWVNWKYQGDVVETSYYELLIPEGSVVNQFNLN